MYAQSKKESVEGFQTRFAALRSRALGAISHVQDVASNAFVAPVVRRLSSVRSMAAKAKATSLAYAMSVTGLATATYESIRRKGARLWAVEFAKSAREAALSASVSAKAQGELLLRETRSKASELAVGAGKVAKDGSFQASAASAAGGAVALGAGGGVAGLTAGTITGSAIGLLAAPFTLGMSIPLGAAVGGTGGLVTGVMAGSTVGALGGGAAGYGVYTKRDTIASTASQTVAKVGDSAEYVKGKAVASTDYLKGRAVASTDYMKDQASLVRARFTGSGCKVES